MVLLLLEESLPGVTAASSLAGVLRFSVFSDMVLLLLARVKSMTIYFIIEVFGLGLPLHPQAPVPLFHLIRRFVRRSPANPVFFPVALIRRFPYTFFVFHFSLFSARRALNVPAGLLELVRSINWSVFLEKRQAQAVC